MREDLASSISFDGRKVVILEFVDVVDVDEHKDPINNDLVGEFTKQKVTGSLAFFKEW
jgi:hypothetical protein